VIWKKSPKTRPVGVLIALTFLAGGCTGMSPEGVDPGPPPQEGPIPSVEEPFDGGDPRSKESLSFEDLVAGLEPGIELSNDPWDPWNDLGSTWAEIFAPNSRTVPSHPYIAQGFEATSYAKLADSGSGTIGLVDPTSFCLDANSDCVGASDLGGAGTGHGQRMALNAINEYPGIGVQAVSMDAHFLPLFGEVDGRYQKMSSQLGVTALTNPILYAISAFALQDSDRAKVMTAATNQRWEFNDTDGLWNGYPFGDSPEQRELVASQGPAWLTGYEWLLKADDEIVVQTAEYGPWTLNRSSYEWAQWWENNQETLNTLLIKSNNNSYADEAGDLVDCFPSSGGMTDDFDPLCGVTDTAMAVTGIGMDSTLFVCAFNPSFSTVVGNHSGPFLEHTIYASGAKYGDTSSCSQATPVVAAIAQKVIDANPSLTAQEVKQVLLRSSVSQSAFRATGFTESGTTIQVTETVLIANSRQAVECARSLECLE